MISQFNQPRGSTSIEVNKQSIARNFGIKEDEVVYFTVGIDISGFKVIYDESTQRAYSLPSGIVSGTTAISLNEQAILTHSSGSVDLGELAVSREEYVTLPGSFNFGHTINVKNELLVHDDVKYRWDGALPKVIDPGSTPASTGGVGLGAWVSVGDASLRASLLSHSIPGASLVSLPNGTVNDAIKYVTPEMFRYASDTTDDQMFRRMWDYAISRNLNIQGDGEYHLAETYEVPEVHTPPVRYDFNMMTIKLRKVVYTASSGVAFINRSPGCVFEIGELAGTAPFTVIDQTIGFQLMGQGRIPNVIHVVHGFATNVKLDECFTRAIHVGECYDALRGVRGVVANANIIYGKIGGGFSESQIDPTTCEVGVTFDSSSNTNEVFANIEYCRRSESSRPFVDDGSTNKFYGYVESCSLPGLVNGSFTRYQVKNGGNNIRTKFGYEVHGPGSSIEMLDAVVDDGVPVTDGNSTITNKNLQSALSKSNQSEVLSRNSKELLSLGKVNQYIVDSNDLVTASWNLAVSGAATAGDLSFTSGVLNAGASNQYRYGTNVVASVPATSQEDFYSIIQNITAAFTGDLSFGIALRMNSGDADFFLKVQSVTGNILYSKAFRMTGTSKIVEHFHSIPTQYIDSDTYSVQLQVRTWEASNFDIFNIHLCNGAGIERAPASIGTGVTPFQPIHNNAVGFHPPRVCKSLNPPLTLKQYDFDTYIINDVDGNVTLYAGYDGQTITFYKVGSSSTALLSSETIDGSPTLALTAGLKITLQFIAELDRWVVLSKNT